MHFFKILCCAFSVVLFVQCKNDSNERPLNELLQSAERVTDNTIINANKNPGDWITHGFNYQEDRFSPLTQINKDNLDQLGLAWAVELGTKRGIQTTPIVIDGIIYATGPWSVVYAINARNGKRLWTYDPEVPRSTALDYCCGVINRGLATYEGDLFLGTLDGRLISLSAVDGSVNWSVNTIEGTGKTYSITGAPRIAKGRVLIGNGGAEYDARGFVSAYEAKTGSLAWRFYTVPGNPDEPYEHPDLEDAAKTWNGEWWKQGGGGTAWDAIVYDPEFNNVYIGVGNGTHWDQLHRSPGGGDNLYLSSIVAVDADNGSYKWHYQTTPGDTWDYTATQHIVLADLEIDGKERKVLMQAPKNGFFYVVDRTDGSLISGEAYTYMNWATGIDENGRPVEVPGARYEDGRTHWIVPGSHGGHNWQPMSFSRNTKLMYIPASSQAGGYQHNPSYGTENDFGVAAALGGQLSFAGRLYFPPVIDPNPLAPPPGTSSGSLLAWDPVKQEEAWSVPQSFHYNGGVLSTASDLVIQGDAEGDLHIRDAYTGESLWSFDVRSGAIASPVTYLVDGEQYITLFVGWGGGQGQSGNVVDRIHQGTAYTFKLGGNATPPENLPSLNKTYTTLSTEADQMNIGHGFNVYLQYCIGCHMNMGMGGGVIPDLTMSNEGIFDAYNSIILEGQLASQGMPNFGEFLSEEDVENLKSFVLYTAEAFRTQTDPMEYAMNLAQMQYASDQNPPQKKNIE